jgi:hypothetical protein
MHARGSVHCAGAGRVQVALRDEDGVSVREVIAEAELNGGRVGRAGWRGIIEPPGPLDVLARIHFSPCPPNSRRNSTSSRAGRGQLAQQRTRRRPNLRFIAQCAPGKLDAGGV